MPIHVFKLSMTRAHRLYIFLMLLLTTISIFLFSSLQRDDSDVQLQPGKVPKISALSPTRASGIDLILVTSKRPQRKQTAFQSVTKLDRLPDCKLLTSGSYSEFAYAEEYMQSNPRKPISPQHILKRTRNCSSFIEERNYMTKPTTSAEKYFPLAFIILAYQDIGHLERLLRSIYAPQNLYCLHIDAKSSDTYYAAVESLRSCFPNVILSPRRIDVKFKQWSYIEAHLECMKVLISPQYWNKWKYMINLSGHEFPLKTNNELVRILQGYKGNNDISGSFLEGRKAVIRIHGGQLKPLPFNLTYAVGEIHGLFTQKFVKFVLEDPKAKVVQDFFRENISLPSEGFFQVLNYNPSLNAPGGFLGTDEQAQAHWVYDWPVRYKVMVPDASPMLIPYLKHGCQSDRYDGATCRYGLPDLKYIIKYAHTGLQLFLHKLQNNPSVVYDCIEEDLLKRRKTSHFKDIYRDFAEPWALRNVVRFGRGGGLEQ